MKLSNFNSINPDIIWKAQNDNQNTSNIRKKIKKELSSDLRLLIPPILGLISIGYISFEIISTTININKYSQDHEEYEQKREALTAKETQNSKMKIRLENTKTKLVSSIHPFIFSKEFQTIVPESVQLKRYEINKNNLFVEAKSYNQKAIDEFIVFMNNHSNVVPNSVNIEELISRTDAELNEQQIDGVNGQIKEVKRSYEVKVSADIRISDEKTLERKSIEYGNYYLLKKLSIFTANQL